METKTGKLTSIATDLEIGVIASIPAKVEEEEKWTVPFRPFMGFITSLPEGPVQLKRIGRSLSVKSGAFQGKFIVGKNEEFPIIPRVSKTDVITLKSKEFLEAIEDVLPATALTETRPELSGVSLSVEGHKLSIAATDTFRLALRTLPYTSDDVFSLILPRRTAQELTRIFREGETIAFRIGEQQCTFDTSDILFSSRLLEGTFPDFRAIIPKDPEVVVRVATRELLSRLDSAAFFTSRFHEVRVTVKHHGSLILISAENSDIGSYETEIRTLEGKGEERTLAFNLRYFLDGIRAIRSDELTMEFYGEGKPLVLRPERRGEDDRYLLMPIRLG
jgi:DNA polymerase-3 subunit beta